MTKVMLRLLSNTRFDCSPGQHSFTSLLPIAPKTLFRFGEVILPWAGESKGAGVLLFSMQKICISNSFTKLLIVFTEPKTVLSARVIIAFQITLSQMAFTTILFIQR